MSVSYALACEVIKKIPHAKSCEVIKKNPYALACEVIKKSHTLKRMIQFSFLLQK